MRSPSPCFKTDGRYSIFRKLTDGSSAEESVFTGDHDVFPTDISPDGKTVLFIEVANSQPSILTLPLAEPGKPSKVIDNGGHASFSPDGRYVAYESEESRSWEVYVVPFGDRKGKWQVSSNTAGLAHWSSDGKDLYYVELANGAFSIVAVPVKEQGGQLQFGSPQTLIGKMNVATFPGYDVSPDGKRILLSRLSQQGNQSVTLVTNFAEGLKK